MKRTLKLALAAAVLSIGSALPAVAQTIDDHIDFKASFPFYAGDERMPAGSYRITQPDSNSDHVLIQSTDGKYGAFVDFIPTFSEQPHEKSSVTFQKNGDVGYVSRISVEGANYGIEIEPTKTELKASSETAVIERPISGN
jgi:hypothetical protein